MASADQTKDLLREVESFPPGWDDECAIVEAREMLKQGVDARTVSAIYGPGIAEKVLQPE